MMVAMDLRSYALEWKSALAEEVDMRSYDTGDVLEHRSKRVGSWLVDPTVSVADSKIGVCTRCRYITPVIRNTQ
jgi:hypothetical protein